MKLINNYWVDENNNKWNKTRYSESLAQEFSKTLINCTNCMNCRNCRNCTNCTDCTNCRNCRNCTDCIYCMDCTYCRNCRNCMDCTNCTDCTDCIYCMDCTYCRNCTNCTDCTNCMDCIYCMDCTYCRNCRNCTDCTNCTYCKELISNPERYISKKLGSRCDNTIFYFLKDSVYVVCGCFTGSLEQFQKQVKEVHGDNEHGIGYQKLIQKVKNMFEITRTET